MAQLAPQFPGAKYVFIGGGVNVIVIHYADLIPLLERGGL